MTTEVMLQWGTVLGFGALLTKLLDMLWAGIKGARAARRAPLDELEITRRSRLIWMDYSAVCKSTALQHGMDVKLFPPLPADPLVRIPVTKE